MEEELKAPVEVPHEASAEEIEVQKTTTLLDERQGVRENIASLRRRMERAEEKLIGYGDYGRELAGASAEESYEWIRVLSSAHAEGAEFLKSLIQTQLDWFSRLGTSKDFFGAVLGEARVVAGTCVGLGNISAVGEQVFDLCIVDEVSKATPTETLIPMCRSRNWILVGDPKQLPPFSEFGERKAIEGFDSEEVNATLLDILSRQLPAECRGKLREQRRMAGGIGTLISEVFYDGDLETIRKESDRNPVIRSVFPKSVEWHSTSKLKAQDDELPGHTFRNVTECLLIQKLLIQLNAANRGKAVLHVAVISAYSAQVRALDERLRSIPGGLPNLMIEVNTVDAFQGKDADVCVYSVTRSNDRRRLGFQREVRRVNVALSRGKDSLVIVGDDMFCRRIESDNPFLGVLTHILNNASDCGMVSYERL
jgi:superfamily I DNA and/or RNA helicase